MNITPKALTVTGLSVPANKVYDSTTATATPNGTPTLQGAEAAGPGTVGDGAPYIGDAVTVGGPATGSYNSKDVAIASLLTFNGLSTANANYTITPPTQAATITTAMTAAVARNQALVLSSASLLSLAQDPDGDPLSITSADPTSTNGGAVSLTGTNITYLPATNFTGADLFSFVVSDPYGASSTGTVLVTVSSPIPPPPSFVVSPDYSNGTFQVTFAGTSNTAYTAQWAPSVTGSWSFFQTVTAGSDGLIQVTDTPVPPVASRDYRIVYP